MISIKSPNRLSSADIQSIVNRFQESHSIVIAMYMPITPIKLITPIAKSVITFPSSMFSKSIKMRIMRKHLEYKIIQKIFNNYKNFIISNLYDLSFDFLMKAFVIFILFANYINKFNIFEFIIYK